MCKVILFAKKLDDWKNLLPNKEKQWKKGYSAYELACCWWNAAKKSGGFPQKVSEVLSKEKNSELKQFLLLLASPEFQVSLPGGNRTSSNDIFILARSQRGLISIMVEGKVDESFGPALERWMDNASQGKQIRLRHLLNVLQLAETPVERMHPIRYQLLHRAASAVLTGMRYRAVAAVLLVHSFSRQNKGWNDYCSSFWRCSGRTE